MPVLTERLWDTSNDQLEIILESSSRSYRKQTIPKELGWAQQHTLKVKVPQPKASRDKVLVHLSMVDSQGSEVELAGRCTATMRPQDAARHVLTAQLCIDFTMACHPQYNSDAGYNFKLLIATSDTVIAEATSAPFRVIIIDADDNLRDQNTKRRSQPTRHKLKAMEFHDVWQQVLTLSHEHQMCLLTRLTALLRARLTASLQYCLPFVTEMGIDVPNDAELSCWGLHGADNRWLPNVSDSNPTDTDASSHIDEIASLRGSILQKKTSSSTSQRRRAQRDKSSPSIQSQLAVQAQRSLQASAAATSKHYRVSQRQSVSPTLSRGRRQSRRQSHHTMPQISNGDEGVEDSDLAISTNTQKKLSRATKKRKVPSEDSDWEPTSTCTRTRTTRQRPTKTRPHQSEMEAQKHPSNASPPCEVAFDDDSGSPSCSRDVVTSQINGMAGQSAAEKQKDGHDGPMSTEQSPAVDTRDGRSCQMDNIMSTVVTNSSAQPIASEVSIGPLGSNSTPQHCSGDGSVKDRQEGLDGMGDDPVAPTNRDTGDDPVVQELLEELFSLPED